MKQNGNTTLAEATTDEQASPPTTRRALALARTSERLAEPWIEAAVEGSQPARPGWSHRLDGWTPDRIRTFLSVLAECGVVGDAARAVGMSRQKAYAFRNSARGRAFAFAWRTALLRGRDRLADEVMSRALDGCVDVIVRDGKVWGERHRYDNRLTMSVLTRLDNMATPKFQRDEMAAVVAPEFDELLDKVCEGGKQTAAFLRSRCGTPHTIVDEAKFLDRAEQYVETGAGLTGEEPSVPVQPAHASNELPDWARLLFANEEEEEEQLVIEDEPAEPSVLPSGEGEKDDEWHMSLLSPSSIPPRACLGEGDHAQHGGGAYSLEGDQPSQSAGEEANPPRNGDAQVSRTPHGSVLSGGAQVRGSPGDCREPQLGCKAAADDLSMDRPAESGGGVTEERDRSSQPVEDCASSPAVAGEGNRAQRGGGGSSGGDCTQESEVASSQGNSTAQSSAQSEPQAEWILSDDGIAIKTVNGRLPLHLRRGCRNLRG